MSQTNPQITSLDLTKFAKSIFEGNDEFDLLKNHNLENHFEPIPNNFYGFAIPIPDGILALAHIFGDNSETIDIGYEDLTNQKLIQ